MMVSDRLGQAGRWPGLCDGGYAVVDGAVGGGLAREIARRGWTGLGPRTGLY